MKRKSADSWVSQAFNHFQRSITNVMTKKKMEEELDEAYDKNEEMKEAAMYEEEPAADDEMGMDDEDEMGGEGDTKEISQDMVDDAAEALASLQGLIDALGGEAGGEEEMDMGDEPEMDMDADMGGEEELDMGGEDEEADEDAEEVIAEALKGVNLKLSENEVVQEVARRVAKRILKAKQAQSRLDEALGNKPVRKSRRFTRRRK